VELLAELESYPVKEDPHHARPAEDYAGVLVPVRLRTDWGVLSFFGTITVFGTPLDVTLAELAIESMFPADPQTAELLAGAARGKTSK
jgi:hypothetical protein